MKLEVTRSKVATPGADAKDAEDVARFLRGLTLGALVGAAIAGSAIWQRARTRSEHGGRPPVDRDVSAETETHP